MRTNNIPLSYRKSKYNYNAVHFPLGIEAPVAQWVKRWPTDLADRVRSPLKAKPSQP